MTHASRTQWELKSLRDAIARDWADLANTNSSAERRRAVRDHLAVSVSALRDLASRHEVALQTARVKRAQKA